MPQLFGTDYLLPLIVVVALLVALLVLLAMRRRSTAGPKGKKQAKLVKAEQVTARSDEATVTAATDEAAVAAAAAQLTRADVVSETAAAIAPAPTPSAPSARPKPAAPPAVSDPLAVVLNDLLQGWGDLTTEETRRLEVFRPERVIAAISAIELPKAKSSENARTRLTQLRQYAGDLERRLRVAAVPRTAADSELFASGETVAEEAEKARGEAPPEGPTTDTAAETVPVLPRSAGPERFWFVPSEPEPTVTTEPVLPATEGTESTRLSATSPTTEEPPLGRKALADIESFWAESETVWEAAPLELQEEPIATEVPEEPTLETYDLAATAEAEVSGIPEEVAAEAKKEDEQAAAGSPEAGAVTLTPSEQSDSLSQLRVTVRTAVDVLRLPEEEQVEMVAFLEPWELAAVFQATRSTDVKRAVIDTLAHIASPTSLSALGTCLDDPDQEIQLYALETAERLLGTAD